MPQISRITAVTTFIDWNSQIHAAKPRRGADPFEICNITLKYVGRYLAKALNDVDPKRRYDVTLRAYHGWHKGFEPSARRKAMVQLFARTDFPALSRRPNVSIRPDLHFGDLLMSASDERLHKSHNIHLPNTWRNIGPNETEEKMVDTALVCEIVDLAHREPDRWLVVVGEDDDLIPAIFIAEGARGVASGKVLLLRTRPDTQYLKLNGLKYLP